MKAALTWNAIIWALEEAGRAAASITDVIVNGRSLGPRLSSDVILRAVRARGGAMVTCGRGPASVRR